MKAKQFTWTPEFWKKWLGGSNPGRSYVVSRVTSRAIMLLNPQPGELILNAGCGFGREAALLMESVEGVRVLGVDISQEMAKTALEHIGPSYPFSAVRSSVERLPFPDRTFDKVICLGVLPHVSDETAACTELLRVLKPKGILVASFNSLLHPLSLLILAYLSKKKHSLPGFKQSLRLPSYYISKLASSDKHIKLYPGSFSIGVGGKTLLPLWKIVDKYLAPACPWATYEPLVRCG